MKKSALIIMSTIVVISFLLACNQKTGEEHKHAPGDKDTCKETTKHKEHKHAPGDKDTCKEEEEKGHKHSESEEKGHDH